jgi:hypothetical protein
VRNWGVPRTARTSLQEGVRDLLRHDYLLAETLETFVLPCRSDYPPIEFGDPVEPGGGIARADEPGELGTQVAVLSDPERWLDAAEGDEDLVAISEDLLSTVQKVMPADPAWTR